MAVTFVVVPQWQGSGSSRAMRLLDGAEAIRGDLPSSATRVIEVPLEAGDAQGSGIHRMSSLLMVRERLAQELATISGPAVVVGGDCAVELAAIERVLPGGDVAVVWFDAHPDLNTPESSPSGAFNGMVLRSLMGEGTAPLVASAPLPAERVILVGVRSVDPPEDEFIGSAGIVSVGVDALTPEGLVAAVAATGASSVYIHIDLDVLDPGDFGGLGYPEPFGVSTTALLDALKALLARFPLAGAGVTEFAPASLDAAVDDLPTILRIVGVLAA